MKRVVFSNHSKERKKQRGLADYDIVETLRNPDYVKTTFEGRRVAIKSVRDRTITVVYVEMGNYIYIITVI